MKGLDEWVRDQSCISVYSGLDVGRVSGEELGLPRTRLQGRGGRDSLSWFSTACRVSPWQTRALAVGGRTRGSCGPA